MRDKKHIDRLFQEKFKDFEVAPDAAVWERIEAQLKEKKKRRVIPIWWRYAGVAAILLILLTIGNGYLSNNNIANDTPNQVVDGNDNNSFKQPQNGNSNENYKNPSNTILKNTETIGNNNVSKERSDKPNINRTGSKNENVVNPSHLSIAGGSVKTNENTMGNGTNTPTIKSNQGNTLKDTNTIPEHTSELANTSEETKKSPELNKSPLDKAKVDNLFNTNKNNKEPHLADTNTKLENTEVSEEQLQLSIEEAIELAKNNDEEEKENKNKWSVTPNVAPVFFNSLGKGSSIDPQFNNNSKSSETNLSYGVSASYAVNDKISVRSGINKVNLGYNTNNVVAVQTIGISSGMSVLKNVKPVLNSPGLNISGNDISVLSSENFANKSSQNFASTSGISTYINQSLSFIEIPLEIKYLISDKKLGIHVVGGFSSFFLNDNELYSDFEGNKIFIGEANNINKTSYSANLGFGLGYKVSKTINLNLEPMFKYQINTFNNTSGHFKPYFIGVYTGFGFKF